MAPLPRKSTRAPAPKAAHGWALPLLVGLGLAAFVNGIAARSAERRYPPRGRFLILDGIPLHMIEQGGGPPVVLLHGNGAMAEDFVASGLVERLAATHRVIVPDRPGFGHSPRLPGRIWSAHAQAELITRVLDQMGIRKAVVLGHSWGVMVALDLALNHPDRVSALVLVGGYYHPTLRLDVPLVSLSALPVVGSVLRHTVLPPLLWLLRRQVLATLFSPRPVTQRFLAAFPLGLALRPSQLRAVAQDTALMIPGTLRLFHRYHELRMPVSIIGGVEDRIVDFDTQSGRLHREIPHSRLHPIIADGHMTHHTEAALVADIVVQAESAARGTALRADQ